MDSKNDSCIYVATALVNMYTKCGSMHEAHQVFNSIKNPDVVAWNALILGYANNGEGITALDLFARMKLQGFLPNSRTYISVLKACTALALANESKREECLYLATQIHSEITFRPDIYLQNTLIDMYAKCGSMLHARHVFMGMKYPDVKSWTCLIMGYAENGEGLTALDLFSRMKSQGYVPDGRTFVAALKACVFLALEKGKSDRKACLDREKQTHSEVASHLDTYVQNTLIDMYAKCGSMIDARRVFDGMKNPDVVSWNVLILGYAENGESVRALDLFARMKSQISSPSNITFIAVLKACSYLALEQDECGRAEWLGQAKEIHAGIIFHGDIFVETTLIDMYAKFGSMVDARLVFDSMKSPNEIAWTALILGYAENGEGDNALNMFVKMRSEGFVPNCVTVHAALKACGSVGAFESGKRIHAQIGTGTKLDAKMITCLVDFYARCGSMIEAQHVFDSHPETRDVTTWTALMAGYSGLGDSDGVFQLFDKMLEAGFDPNNITILCILTCCRHAGHFEKATKFFEAMFTTYGISPAVEHYGCMVDILGRSNKLNDAMALLRSMPCKPVAETWLTLFGACHRWKNVPIGRLAFESLVNMEDPSAAVYVQMSNLYRSKTPWKEPEQSCWMHKDGKVHRLTSMF